MIKVVILNDTRNSNKDKFENDDGFSAYIEVENNKILFDVGPSEKFMKNAEKLGLDLNKVDTIVLSHGHYDHGDGLKFFNNKVEFIAHPNCTLKRWWKEDHSHYSGIQLTKEELKNKYNVHFTKEPYKINKDTYYLGEITRKYPINLKKWVLANGQNDEMLDDSGMVIDTEDGITVIAGCSHSGICNIVEHAKMVTNNNRVLAVIGGFHLREVDEDTNKVIDYMKDNVEEVILAHCTADDVCNKFINDLKDRIKVSVTEVGREYKF